MVIYDGGRMAAPLVDMKLFMMAATIHPDFTIHPDLSGIHTLTHAPTGQCAYISYPYKGCNEWVTTIAYKHFSPLWHMKAWVCYGG